MYVIIIAYYFLCCGHILGLLSKKLFIMQKNKNPHLQTLYQFKPKHYQKSSSVELNSNGWSDSDSLGFTCEKHGHFPSSDKRTQGQKECQRWGFNSVLLGWYLRCMQTLGGQLQLIISPACGFLPLPFQVSVWVPRRLQPFLYIACVWFCPPKEIFCSPSQVEFGCLHNAFCSFLLDLPKNRCFCL